jgi:L-asparaginase
MKNILYISTGGTISSTHGREGIVPTVEANAMLELVPSVKRLCGVEARTVMSIDSTNMQPEDWCVIAKTAFEGLGRFDGVVVSHGTHTMAYTASALTFMIRNPGKPIVFTGAQVPVDEGGTDAKRNLVDAFRVACEPIAGVFLVFNGMIALGCRVSKARSRHTDAFVSVNVPPVGSVLAGKVRYSGMQPANGRRGSPDRRLSPAGEFSRVPQRETDGTGLTAEGPSLLPGVCPDVFLIRVFPGLNPGVFDALPALGTRGVVVEGYGIGSIPFLKRNLLPKMKELLDRGIAVAITTQAIFDGTDLSLYKVGKECLAMGAIEGRDMSSEALVAKLMWALGQTMDMDEVRKIMATNFAGEVALDG